MSDEPIDLTPILDLEGRDPEERCSTCGGTVYGTQRAVVAFGPQGSAIVYGTPHLLHDLKMAMINSGDIWSDDSAEGLAVWEGRIVYSMTPNTPNGPSECDVDYKGRFRDLTDAEWASVRKGENPFAEEKTAFYEPYASGVCSMGAIPVGAPAQGCTCRTHESHDLGVPCPAHPRDDDEDEEKP